MSVRNPEFGDKKSSRTPYIACLFNLCLASVLLWLAISDQAWSTMHPALSMPPTLIVLNALIPIGIARFGAPERVASMISRYGVEVSEQESKLMRACNLGTVRMFSLLFIVDILAYVFLIFMLEIATPSLFVENSVRVLVTSGIYFALMMPSAVSAAYFYRRRYPELRRIQDELRERARRGH